MGISSYPVECLGIW